MVATVAKVRTITIGITLVHTIETVYSKDMVEVAVAAASVVVEAPEATMGPNNNNMDIVVAIQTIKKHHKGKCRL